MSTESFDSAVACLRTSLPGTSSGREQCAHRSSRFLGPLPPGGSSALPTQATAEFRPQSAPAHEKTTKRCGPDSRAHLFALSVAQVFIRSLAVRRAVCERIVAESRENAWGHQMRHPTSSSEFSAASVQKARRSARTLCSSEVRLVDRPAVVPLTTRAIVPAAAAGGCKPAAGQPCAALAARRSAGVETHFLAHRQPACGAMRMRLAWGRPRRERRDLLSGRSSVSPQDRGGALCQGPPHGA